MSSAKGLLLDTFGRLILRYARVISIRELGEGLRSIELEGPALRDISWTPGDKLQVLLPTRDVRTYTPVTWDPAKGTTEIIVFEHGEGPGALWSRDLEVGDSTRFVGPQRSLHRRARPALVFGDETSFGVALALRGQQPKLPFHAVFEVGTSARQQVLAKLGFEPVVAIERREQDAHLADVATEIARWTREHRDAELFFTGRAQAIQALRPHLRTAGVRDRGSSKAYWSVGKTGLD